MEIVGYTGRDDLATVYVAKMSDGRLVEFVESVQPPVPREEKWVLIVSTLFGCPVRCPICDAGSEYRGKLAKSEILEQIDFLIRKDFPDGKVPTGKFKIQFARMGDPAFNPAVPEVLRELPELYDAPGLMPCISTVAPSGTTEFFEQLLEIKHDLYQGCFQLQFSVHSTDENVRDRLIPINKWGFDQIARYGRRFHGIGDRKVALNFALAEGSPVDPVKLRRFFDPDTFLIKITPVNPTYSAAANKLVSGIDPLAQGQLPLAERLRACGFEVIVSIGEVRENQIGSNCGQYVMTSQKGATLAEPGYLTGLQQYR